MGAVNVFGCSNSLIKVKMINVEEFNQIDEILMGIAKFVKPLLYAEPVNEKEQKSEFLAGRIRNPQFSYKPLEYDPSSVETKLAGARIPDNELGRVFERKRRNILLENNININRGNREAVIGATSEIYGVPSEAVVTYADTLLRGTRFDEEEKTVSSDEVLAAIREGLNEAGLNEWSAEFSDKKLTTVYTAEKKVTVCKDRKFRKGEPARLKVHEVGVHVLRSANGFRQPLKIFGLGFPGCSQTEEGMTSFFEETTGTSDLESIMDYAGRVIAVDSVCRGFDFRSTFERLKSYNLSDDRAWNLSVRAHRAGGYIKDHIYIDGYLKVKRYAQECGDFRTLYVGKIGLEDLALTKKLLAEGVLSQPKNLPWFL